ncbi:MAG: hypothetical protein GXO02_05505 [Epsilonproteobacteria bacterium]|nr:hypothetical protein [Campylobacterota bacterium]
MIIFGDAMVDSKEFVKVNSIDDIKNSSSNSVVVIPSLKENELIDFCKNNSIEYGVELFSPNNAIRDLIFAFNLKASYILISFLDVAKTLQDIVNEYLMDLKVIYVTNSYNEIDEAAKMGIDGVILNKNIKEI